jgi:hypothetical protein
MAIIMMSRFHAALQECHLEYLTLMHGYQKKFSSAAIHHSVLDSPDFTRLTIQEFDRCHIVYQLFTEV